MRTGQKMSEVALGAFLVSLSPILYAVTDSMIQGADPSIIQVGEKRPSNARERKVLKKPRIIKQEPANPARVPPAQKSVSTSDDSVIIVEDDDSSDEWYVDMKTVADVKERVKDSMKVST